MSAISLSRLAFGALLLLPAAGVAAQERPPAVQQMVKAFGIGSFGKVEGIRYTWNADTPNGTISRKWEWNPKTDTVSYEGKDKQGNPVKATYSRAQLDKQSDAVKNEVDPAFLNDQYWALLPFHVVWDDSATVTDEGRQKVPLGDAKGEKIVVKYPQEGGYDPGDTWELYLRPDHRVGQMVYHRGGAKPPKLVIATWVDYKKAGPILFSTEHRGTVDGKPLHLFLTDVSVKLAGSQGWIKAH